MRLERCRFNNSVLLPEFWGGRRPATGSHGKQKLMKAFMLKGRNPDIIQVCWIRLIRRGGSTKMKRVVKGLLIGCGLLALTAGAFAQDRRLLGSRSPGARVSHGFL